MIHSLWNPDQTRTEWLSIQWYVFVVNDSKWVFACKGFDGFSIWMAAKPFLAFALFVHFIFPLASAAFFIAFTCGCFDFISIDISSNSQFRFSWTEEIGNILTIVVLGIFILNASFELSLFQGQSRTFTISWFFWKLWPGCRIIWFFRTSNFWFVSVGFTSARFARARFTTVGFTTAGIITAGFFWSIIFRFSITWFPDLETLPIIFGTYT